MKLFQRLFGFKLLATLLIGVIMGLTFGFSAVAKEKPVKLVFWIQEPQLGQFLAETLPDIEKKIQLENRDCAKNRCHYGTSTSLCCYGKRRM